MADNDMFEVELKNIKKILEELREDFKSYRENQEPRLRKLEDWKLQMQTTLLPVGILLSALLSGLGKWLFEILTR
jgi:signal recognition particle subunit SEC65